MNAVITIGPHGLIAPCIHITRREPLIGRIDSIAFACDGSLLMLRRIPSMAFFERPLQEVGMDLLRQFEDLASKHAQDDQLLEVEADAQAGAPQADDT